jgi:hypothetical protein
MAKQPIILSEEIEIIPAPAGARRARNAAGDNLEQLEIMIKLGHKVLRAKQKCCR